MLKRFSQVLIVIWSLNGMAQDTYVCVDAKGKKAFQNWPCDKKAPSPEGETARLKKIQRDRYPNLIACSAVGSDSKHCVDEFNRSKSIK